MLAVLAAATAGAVGGLAYSLTRPFLTRLATAGDYLTGVVCVGAYLGALCALAPIAFGESITKQRSDLVILGVISLVFGLLMGHRWFRDQD